MTPPTRLEELKRLAASVGCLDHSCRFVPKKEGMRTNGGCRCVPRSTLNWSPAEKLAFEASTAIPELCDEVERLRGALEVFENRRKLAHSLREESPQVAAFMSAVGVQVDKALKESP